MSVTLDLGPLERLLDEAEDVAEAACEHAAEDVLGRFKAMEPRDTGSLIESLAIKTGTKPGEGFAVIGPESDKSYFQGESDRSRPVAYQEAVEADHGYFMRTLLGPGDVDALAEGAAQAIEKVLHGDPPAR